jgi:tetratricopeptide (TPR) repeat protein
MRHTPLRSSLLLLTLLLSLRAAPLVLAAPAAPPAPNAEVAALLQKGIQAYRTSHFKESLGAFEEALARARALSDKAGEAAALQNIGFVYNGQGERQKALEFYNQALPLRRAVGDRKWCCPGRCPCPSVGSPPVPITSPQSMSNRCWESRFWEKPTSWWMTSFRH